MRLVKRQSKKTYVGEDKKERHYTNYLLELDNGKRILVKPVKDEDYRVFDVIAEFERSNIVK